MKGVTTMRCKSIGALFAPLAVLLILAGCGGGGSSFNNVGDNSVPVIENVTVQNISTDGTKRIYFTTYDADGDTLDVNVSATNGTATLEAPGEIAFNPSADYIGYAVITIGADDNNGGTVTLDVIIDETPNILPILNDAAMSVNENTVSGTIIGVIGILDPGDTAINSIDLSGTGASNFLVSTGGVVTVAGGATLDYESATLYNLTASATNNAGTSADVNVTITINDLADVVPVLSDEVASINENAAAGSVVDSISIVTPGDRPITSIVLSGTGASDFTVATDGTISVATGALLDYESRAVYTLSAVATSISGSSAAVSVTIYLNNVADVPPTLGAVSGSVDEDAAAGTPVLTIPITSSGDSAITSITLSGVGAANFTVTTAGVVGVASGAALDYESTTSYALVASAANAAGSSANVNVLIAVNDVPDVLPVVSDALFSVDENATAGSVVGSIAIDPGDSAVTLVDISGAGAEHFDLSTSGVLSLAATAVLDYETLSHYTLSVRAFNGAGWSAWAALEIDVVNDPALTPARPGTQLKTPLLMIGAGFEGTPFEGTASAWNLRLFGGNEGSLSHYFSEISRGRFTLIPASERGGTGDDGIVLVQLLVPHPGAEGTDGAFIVALLRAADDSVDFAGFDRNGDGTVSRDELQLLLVAAGGEASAGDHPSRSVWARNGALSEPVVLDGVKLLDAAGGGNYLLVGEKQGTQPARIGVIAHEMGHARFALRDLYDIDGSSAGIGYFGLMGRGLWGAKQGEVPGSSPVHPCAWSKLQAGWAAAETVTATQTNRLLEGSDALEYNVLKLPTGDPREYFLLENRSPGGYDAGLDALQQSPFGGGVAIWHVDERQLCGDGTDNSDDAFRLVDLEEASGAPQPGSVNDLYDSGNADRFDDTTQPSSRSADGNATGVGVENVSVQGSAGEAYRMSLDLVISEVNP